METSWGKEQMKNLESESKKKWDKLREELGMTTIDPGANPRYIPKAEWDLYKQIDEEKYKRAPANNSWQKFDEAGQWPNRPITEEEFKEHCGPEVYAKVEEIRRERRFYDIMEGKIECSEEMKKFWPIVDTSTNARRQVPEPWPWWFTAIGMIGGLIWFYLILKYSIAPN